MLITWLMIVKDDLMVKNLQMYSYNKHKAGVFTVLCFNFVQNTVSRNNPTSRKKNMGNNCYMFTCKLGLLSQTSVCSVPGHQHFVRSFRWLVSVWLARFVVMDADLCYNYDYIQISNYERKMASQNDRNVNVTYLKWHTMTVVEGR